MEQKINSIANVTKDTILYTRRNGQIVAMRFNELIVTQENRWAYLIGSVVFADGECLSFGHEGNEKKLYDYKIIKQLNGIFATIDDAIRGVNNLWEINPNCRESVLSIMRHHYHTAEWGGWETSMNMLKGWFWNSTIMAPEEKFIKYYDILNMKPATRKTILCDDYYYVFSPVMSYQTPQECYSDQRVQVVLFPPF